MTLATPTDLINLSLRAVGVIGVGQTALPQDYTDGLDALNALLAIWNRQRYLIWHLVDVSVPATGAQSYTIGPGADFDTPRPNRIEAAFFRQTVTAPLNQVDFPLMILEAREDYNQIALKGLSTTLPQYLFYDAAFPLGSVYPWPIPVAGLGEIHMSVKETLAQFATMTDPLNLPPEYVRALWSNLAVDLGAIYPGSVVTDDTRRIAKASLAVLRGSNTQMPVLRMPPTLRHNVGGYNILADR